MPTGAQNTKSRQVAIRLPHNLDERIQQYAADHNLTQSQALVDLLEKGLSGVHDNGMHWVAPAEIAALVARVEALEATVARPKTRSQHKPKAGELDPARHYLGPLCQRGHDWQGSGQSRYSKRNQGCMECEAERARGRRAAKKSTV
jgi:hypothetical protein